MKSEARKGRLGALDRGTLALSFGSKKIECLSDCFFFFFQLTLASLSISISLSRLVFHRSLPCSFYSPCCSVEASSQSPPLPSARFQQTKPKTNIKNNKRKNGFDLFLHGVAAVARRRVAGKELQRRLFGAEERRRLGGQGAVQDRRGEWCWLVVCVREREEKKGGRARERRVQLRESASEIYSFSCLTGFSTAPTLARSLACSLVALFFQPLLSRSPLSSSSSSLSFLLPRPAVRRSGLFFLLLRFFNSNYLALTSST